MSAPIVNMPGPDGAALDAMRARLQRRRKATNVVALTASLAAMAIRCANGLRPTVDVKQRSANAGRSSPFRNVR